MIIPALEDVLEEQNDLNGLCADRELKTKEIFSGNAFYGNDRIIKEFAGLPYKYPLKFVIPHGVVFSRSYVWEAELKCNLASVMCYQQTRIDSYKDRMGRCQNVFRGAAPYTYIPELIGNNKKPTKGSGTIFFPAHSTHNLTCEMDYELLAEKLVSLDEGYQPVTVCMYWRDYNLGRSDIFKKKGLSVVSAGHIFDPLFLFRFYYLCSLHEYSACNQIGTHVFYAQYTGCKHFTIDAGDVSREAEAAVVERDSPADVTECIEDFNKLLSHSLETINEKNNILEDFLSPSLKKSRMGLKALLLKTELIHLCYKSSNSRLISNLRNVSRLL